VKTRLIPALGAAGAARLHERLVDRTLAVAVGSGVGPVELCGDFTGDPFLAARGAAHGAALTEQGPGDLGARMHRALARMLPRAPAAILVGSDCPALTRAHLRAAAAALAAGDDAALGPAEDGGYVLIGLARLHPSLFEGIAWGGPEVLAQTRARLAVLGWRWAELDALWDVDRPADLARLAGDPLLEGLEG
jgi:rSAM/selenodomain-associated transferase 1